MKSLSEITSYALHDCGAMCGVNPYRDVLTITERVKNEGESFLTITLPAFCVEFERALAEGCWSTSHSSSFSCGRKRSLPRFLGGFFDQIFDKIGVIRPCSDEQIRAIFAIRQICRMSSKRLYACTVTREKRAIARYLDVEKEVRSHVPNHELLAIFRLVARCVWSELLGSASVDEHYLALRPRHGSGTTADSVIGNDKYRFRSWPHRLNQTFPFSEFGVSNILNPDSEESLRTVRYLLPREETPVKVVPVPKTSKTPRIIAKEPVAMQFMQQALTSWLVPLIETKGRYTSGHVNFRNQQVNNQLARIGSKNGFYATIDMSDASDRVSCKLVDLMLDSVPFFKEWVFATRSTRAELPDGTIVPLRKFASMGSATCFPIEAMAFFIAIVSSRIHRSGLTPTSREIYRKSRAVYVYGDDIIVPADVTPFVIEDLESFGFKVNATKSFWTGKFRESCGGDYYAGEDVKPVYLRRNIPDHKADVNGIISAVAFANQLYWAGMWKTARMVRESIEDLIGPLPSVAVNDQILGWESYSNARSFQAWHNEYQRVKLRGYVVTPRRRDDPLDGDPALLKCLLLVGLPTNDRRHLLSSVRYGNLALKRRWI